MRVSLLLCIFGFFREIRPIEPFTIEYFITEKNVTREEIIHDLYPWGTYAYLFQIIIVFLVTDALRWVYDLSWFSRNPINHFKWNPCQLLDTNQWYYCRRWPAVWYLRWLHGRTVSLDYCCRRYSTAHTWPLKSPTSRTSMQRLNAANTNWSLVKHVRQNWSAVFWAALYHKYSYRLISWIIVDWLIFRLPVSEIYRQLSETNKLNIRKFVCMQCSALRWFGHFFCHRSAPAYIFTMRTSLVRRMIARMCDKIFRTAIAQWKWNARKDVWMPQILVKRARMKRTPEAKVQQNFRLQLHSRNLQFNWRHHTPTSPSLNGAFGGQSQCVAICR